MVDRRPLLESERLLNSQGCGMCSSCIRHLIVRTAALPAITKNHTVQKTVIAVDTFTNTCQTVHEQRQDALIRAILNSLIISQVWQRKSQPNETNSSNTSKQEFAFSHLSFLLLLLSTRRHTIAAETPREITPSSSINFFSVNTRFWHGNHRRNG